MNQVRNINRQNEARKELLKRMRKLMPKALAFFLGFFFLTFTASVWADEIDILIPYIIQVESSGNPNAVSPDGCIGLMQVSPIVFKEYQNCRSPLPKDTILLSEWTFDNMFNPNSNIEVGTWYLRRLKEHYLKNQYTIERMLSAYNGGITRLKKLLQEGKDWQDMPKESVNYVKKIMKLYKQKGHLK